MINIAHDKLNNTLYHPHIDGLRALAVLSVLFYHAGFKVFSGGFVGVDVFFVISGFLITDSIYREIKTGSFSFTNFYVRRARRLLPALYFTLLFSFVAAYLMFSPEHFERFGGAFHHAVLSISNFYFWGESGYFDTSNNIKPLLHTWSLSVEEQFYFIWPALLVFLLTRFHKIITPIFIIFISVASIWFSQKWLLKDPAAVFYLVPFRAFEFGVGAILVWLIKYQLRNKIYHELLLLLGLVLILYPILNYSDETIFPGLNALLPALGSALIIYSGSARYLGVILNNSIAVRVGLISYSIYLIHYPIIIFYKYYIYSEFSYIDAGIVSLGSITIAYAMYNYVEKAFRYRTGSLHLSSQRFVILFIILTLVFSYIGSHAWANEGWVWRLPDFLQSTTTPTNKKENRKYLWERYKEYQSPGFDEKKRKILIIGDSQSADLLNMFVENGVDKSASIRVLKMHTKCGGVYIEKTNRNKYWNYENKRTMKETGMIDVCENIIDEIFSSSLIFDATEIYLANYWRPYSIPYIEQTIVKLRRSNSKKIVIVGRKDFWTYSSASIMNKYRKPDLDGLKRFAFTLRNNKETPIINNALSAKAYNSDVVFFDFTNIICESGSKCLVVTPDAKPLFFDHTHLSKSAATFLGEKVVKLIFKL